MENITIYLSNIYNKDIANKMENQQTPKKIHGTVKIIAKKAGASKEYVGRVLAGKVKQDGQKAVKILEIAREVENALS